MSKRQLYADQQGIQLENKKKSAVKRNFSDESIGSVKKIKTGTNGRRYKSLLVCAVCNGEAHGYNFDAISCESCKAFFRRNALRLSGKLKCRSGGQCDVSVNITRRCKKCRLEKCFRSGMRKEWILSQAEKEEKRRKILENRRLKQIQDNQQRQKASTKHESSSDEDLSLDFFSFLDEAFLTDYEWFQIQTIENTYIAAVQLNQMSGVVTYPSIQALQSTYDLLHMPLYITCMRLINFFKQISEFHQLAEKDKIQLIKLNLITVCFFHSIFLYDPTTNTYHEQDTKDPIYSGEDWMNTFNKQLHCQLQQLRKDFSDIFQCNDAIIKLIFLILILSPRISLEQSLICSAAEFDAVSIFNAQNIFAELMYRLFSHQFGAVKAPGLFARCISKLMKLQHMIDELKLTIFDYVDISQLSPLMNSLLL